MISLVSTPRLRNWNGIENDSALELIATDKADNQAATASRSSAISIFPGAIVARWMQGRTASGLSIALRAAASSRSRIRRMSSAEGSIRRSIGRRLRRWLRIAEDSCCSNDFAGSRHPLVALELSVSPSPTIMRLET